MVNRLYNNLGDRSIKDAVGAEGVIDKTCHFIYPPPLDVDIYPPALDVVIHHLFNGQCLMVNFLDFLANG